MNAATGGGPAPGRRGRRVSKAWTQRPQRRRRERRGPAGAAKSGLRTHIPLTPAKAGAQAFLGPAKARRACAPFGPASGREGRCRLGPSAISAPSPRSLRLILQVGAAPAGRPPPALRAASPAGGGGEGLAAGPLRPAGLRPPPAGEERRSFSSPVPTGEVSAKPTEGAPVRPLSARALCDLRAVSAVSAVDLAGRRRASRQARSGPPGHLPRGRGRRGALSPLPCQRGRCRRSRRRGPR